MGNNENKPPDAKGDAPSVKRPGLVADRYDITPRLAGDWLRAMRVAGVVRKLGGMHVGRWSAIDAWVESGGQVTTKRKAGAR